MLHLTLSRLAAHRRRLLGTMTSIILGVAFLSGTLLLGNTLEANFDRLFNEAVGSTDVIVRGAVDVSTEPQQGQSLVPLTVLDTVRSVEGVDRAEAQWQGYAQLIGADGRAVGGNGPPTLGSNWIDDPELNPYHLAEGRAPAADDEVVVNRAALRTAGLALGSRATVRTPEPVTVTVVGAAAFGDADGMGPTTYVGFTEAAARARLTRNPDRVSAVLVHGDGTDPGELAARVSAGLPPGVAAVTGPQLAAENVTQLGQEFLDLLRIFLLVFSSIALLVATVSIYNTFSIVAAQRTRDSALVRAVGASRRQVLTGGLIESAVLGALASGMGVVAGVGVTQLLEALFGAAGAPLPTGGLAISARDLLVAFAVGVVVTLAAGLVPAVRASAVSPLAALRSTSTESSSLRNRTVAGGVVVAAALALLVTGEPYLAAGGSVALLAGVLVAAPAAVAGLARLARGPFERMRGLTGALAVENAARNPRRTASTASALLVGVGVVTLISVTVSSLGASTRDELSRRLRADVVVSTGQFGGGGFSPALAGTLGSRPEVGGAVGVGSAVALVDGQDRELSVVDPVAVGAVVDLGRVEGSVAGLGPRELAVARNRAAGWTVGHTVSVTFADGTTEDWRVGALFDGTDLVDEVLIGRAGWAPHATQDLDELVLLRAAPGVPVAAVEAAASEVAAGYGSPEVLDRATYIERSTAFMDRLLTIVYLMLALAIVIALMGIGTTLSLAIGERTRELGLLRAVGQTRAQVRSMVRWESAFIAVFGALSGALLGVLLGAALVRTMATEASPTVLSVPGGRVAAVVVVAVGAGVLAARRPARRAARLGVLDALSQA